MNALDRAHVAWGDQLPDWIEVLVKGCMQQSQNVIAKQLGYSSAAVSNAINNKYGGDLCAIEQSVRGAFMAVTVDCPAVGELAADRCNTHQRAAWSPHNPQRITFYRACRSGCPNSRIGGKDGQ